MEESALHKAGRILLLVGAIMSVVAGLILFVTSIGVLALGGAATETANDAAVLDVIGLLYVGLGLLTFVGATFGFLAFRDARHGNVHGAWIKGLVAALLPPVQVLLLVGAILVLVSPEHEAWKAHA